MEVKMQNNRIQKRLEGSNEGRYVLYWMQASQRVQWNHALAYAIERANVLGKPLLVYFGLTAGYPEANVRHYTFMLEGLTETSEALKALGIGWILRLDSPDEGIKEVLHDACELVMDTGYMRIQRHWRDQVVCYIESSKAIPVYQVEADVVVPVTTVTQKEEYSARTIRPKILGQMGDYILPPDIEGPEVFYDLELDMDGLDSVNVTQLVEKLDLDGSVQPVQKFRGGTSQALKHFESFLDQKLAHYPLRNHPEFDYMSNLSPYLHFGQIAPAYVVHAVYAHLQAHPEKSEAADGFLEELVVRRELAINFVYFNPHYDAFEHMTYEWAYETMAVHIHDEREYTYTRAALEGAKTHDPYWNASMLEMKETGKMHTYMRMYWCKKIMEWAEDYKTAYDTALYLNNKYFLDGRDPCSYTGVAWCFGKHDRAWKERAVFGKLRYMNSNGLRRKFDMAPYVARFNGA